MRSRPRFQSRRPLSRPRRRRRRRPRMLTTTTTTTRATTTTSRATLATAATQEGTNDRPTTPKEGPGRRPALLLFGLAGQVSHWCRPRSVGQARHAEDVLDGREQRVMVVAHGADAVLHVGPQHQREHTVVAATAVLVPRDEEHRVRLPRRRARDRADRLAQPVVTDSDRAVVLVVTYVGADPGEARRGRVHVLRELAER